MDRESTTLEKNWMHLLVTFLGKTFLKNYSILIKKNSNMNNNNKNNQAIKNLYYPHLFDIYKRLLPPKKVRLLLKTIYKN